MAQYKLLIGGDLVDGEATLDVVNPATGGVLATCPHASEAQLNQAVAAAKAAFPAWAARSIEDRREVLNAVADAMEADSEAFERLMTQEQGKALSLSKFEVHHTIEMLRTFAAMDLPVEILRETETDRILRQYTPLGVIAAIVPWNFPLVLLMVKFAPALIAGNTIVIKPASTTPLTTLRLGETCQRLLPPGVVNIITDQNELGGLLSTHPDIRKIAFTGSTGTGRKVMAGAAPTLKRLTLELGGNDASIILDDADPKVAAKALFGSAMINSGQLCLAAKRAYVPDALYDAVCDELVVLANAAVVGDGLEQGVQFGPIQNKAQYDRVLDLIEDSRKVGKIIAGGHALDRPGYFIAPTIVCDVPDNARIVQEEQFGPVLPVLRYSDIDDALARANDSEFGLGATIWTSNPDRGAEIALRVESGTVWVNKHLDVPFDIGTRPAKQSGFGVEFGLEGLKEFAQAKIINVSLKNEAA